MGRKNRNEWEMGKQQDDRLKKGIRTALTIILAVGCFGGGAATTWFSLDPELRSLVKTKKAIDMFYYEEVDDSEFYDVIFDAINQGLLDDYSYCHYY